MVVLPPSRKVPQTLSPTEVCLRCKITRILPTAAIRLFPRGFGLGCHHSRHQRSFLVHFVILGPGKRDVERDSKCLAAQTSICVVVTRCWRERDAAVKWHQFSRLFRATATHGSMVDVTSACQRSSPCNLVSAGKLCFLCVQCGLQPVHYTNLSVNIEAKHWVYQKWRRDMETGLNFVFLCSKGWLKTVTAHFRCYFLSTGALDRVSDYRKEQPSWSVNSLAFLAYSMQITTVSLNDKFPSKHGTINI